MHVENSADSKGVEPAILVVTPGGHNPWMLINALKAEFPGIRVLLEKPEPKGELFLRRARRSGVINALGQFGTMLVSRVGKVLALRRLNEIAAQYRLDPRPAVDIDVIPVDDINGDRALSLIAATRPAVILTVSCRLLTPATLAAIRCPVINVHPAINPQYRGQMGAYWSLVERDAKNFGLTVHLVDEGVDTGAILYQLRSHPEPGDTMLTYPALLTAKGVTITADAIRDALQDRLRPREPEGPSILRMNVTLWSWIFHGLTKGIW